MRMIGTKEFAFGNSDQSQIKRMAFGQIERFRLPPKREGNMFHESPKLSFGRFSLLLRNVFQIRFVHVENCSLTRCDSPSSHDGKNSYPSPNHVHKRRRICSIKDRVSDQEKTANDVEDRKSTRLNSSHQIISYAVFCLK